MIDNSGKLPGEGNRVQWHVGPDFSIPAISGQFGHGQGIGQQQSNEEHPALFDQSQFKNDLGPVYAVPTYPWQQENVQSTGGSGAQRQLLDEHPALFDQNQLKNNLGPVYAVPTFPWQQGNVQSAGGGAHWPHGHGHSGGSGQWQQRGHYPQTFMPCYINFPYGCCRWVYPRTGF